MKKWILSLIVLASVQSFAGTVDVSQEVLASANSFISANCDYEKSDRAYVLESASVLTQKYDQMLFDNYYTLVFGSRSAHLGSTISGTLRIQGVQNWNSEEIVWTVSAGACR